jgi:hypothetical protein
MERLSVSFVCHVLLEPFGFGKISFTVVSAAERPIHRLVRKAYHPFAMDV